MAQMFSIVQCKFGARTREDEPVGTFAPNSPTLMKWMCHCLIRRLCCALGLRGLAATSTSPQKPSGSEQGQATSALRAPHSLRSLPLAPLPTSTSSHNHAVLFTVSALLSILLLVLGFLLSLSLQGHSFSLLTPSPAHLRSDPQMTPVGCVDTSSSTSVLTWTPDSANLLVFLLLAWRLTSSLSRLQEASMSKYFQIQGSLLNCTGAEEGIPGART